MKLLKIKTLLSIIFISGLILSACNNKKVYKEIHNMPNKSWTKDNIVTFKPELEGNKQKHHIKLLLRHIYGFALTEFQVFTEMITPSGEVISKNITVEVMNDSREYNSECLGDYCDLEVTVFNDYIFKETGTYTFKFEHQAGLNPLPYVLDVGLLIEKTNGNE
jgi:gliding motility-associated lipoprotein GldH